MNYGVVLPIWQLTIAEAESLTLRAEELVGGLVSRLDGGTLFLDEIGELAPDAQAMLLRFLQTGEG